MLDTKSLKAVSITEIEEAIAKAISGLTGTEASATISSFVINANTNAAAAAVFSGKDTFTLDIYLRVGRSYNGVAEPSNPPF